MGVQSEKHKQINNGDRDCSRTGKKKVNKKRYRETKLIKELTKSTQIKSKEQSIYRKLLDCILNTQLKNKK